MSNRLLNRLEKENRIFNEVKGSIIHKGLIACSYYAIKAKQSFQLEKEAQGEDRKYLPPYSDDKPSAFHFSPLALFSLFDGSSLELFSDFYDRKGIRIQLTTSNYSFRWALPTFVSSFDSPGFFFDISPPPPGFLLP